MLPLMSAPQDSSRGHRASASLVPRIAVVGIVAVAASLLAVPAPSFAASSSDARHAIAASLDGHTYLEDIESGKITVEQIVEVNLMARSTQAHAAGTAAPSRQAITQQVTQELSNLRAGATPTGGSDPDSTSGTRVVRDPLAADKHWWNKLIHWTTLRASADRLLVAGSVSGALLAVIAYGCASYGAYVCAALASLPSIAAASIARFAAKCLNAGHRQVYVTIPDFWNIHCRD